MLVLSAADVERLLDLDRLVDVLAEAMADLSAGRASVPSRIAADVEPREAFLAAMPAYLPSTGALTTKLVSVFPHNTEIETHQAVICCFDPDDGAPLALMDGTYITAARTAAGSALATRLLARQGAAVVGVVGTGTQARSHAVALARLDGIEVIRIAGRDDRAAERLVGELVDRGIPAEVGGSIEEVVGTSDVVCATTHADRPVIRREWLAPGTHVNSVGYNPAGEGEVDGGTIRDAFVVVESRAAALADPPAGAVELRRAIDAGVIDQGHVATEVGEIVRGAPGRSDDQELTLYKSVGVAVQDAAAATLVLESRSPTIGQEVTLA